MNVERKEMNQKLLECEKKFGSMQSETKSLESLTNNLREEMTKCHAQMANQAQTFRNEMNSAMENQAQMFEKELEIQKNAITNLQTALANQSIKCASKQNLKKEHEEESITEKQTKQKFIEYQLKCDDMESQLKKLTKRLTNDINEKMSEQKEKEIENGDGDKISIEQKEGSG